MIHWKNRLHEIIFEAETKAGKAFDIALIWSILISVALVMLESISSVSVHFGTHLYLAEWAFTILFTIEYLLRILSVRKPGRYIFSFFGIIDFLAILPTYLSLIVPGTQSLLIIRVFRLLRVFRIFKLGAHLSEAKMLYSALRASGAKITVFLFVVGATVVTMGAIMYVIEGPKYGFNSIPHSIYWAIVTMTTVGYGDLTPKTPLGQFFASCLMIAGYGIIAVPTGIVTTELVKVSRHGPPSTEACPNCSAEGHDRDAQFCKYCGSKL